MEFDFDFKLPDFNLPKFDTDILSGIGAFNPKLTNNPYTPQLTDDEVLDQIITKNISEGMYSPKVREDFFADLGGHPRTDSDEDLDFIGPPSRTMGIPEESPNSQPGWLEQIISAGKKALPDWLKSLASKGKDAAAAAGGFAKDNPLLTGGLGGAALMALLSSMGNKQQQAPQYIGLGASGPAPAAAPTQFVQLPSQAQSYQSMMGMKDGGAVALYERWRKENPVLTGALDYMPVSGQALSGIDAVIAANKGNYGDAAANLMGLIPLLKARKMASAGREALEQAAKAGRYIDRLNDADQTAERTAQKYGTVRKANGGVVHMQSGDFVFSKKAMDKVGGIEGLKRRGYPAKKIVGPGTGTSDSIPATIDGKPVARVANGEALIPGGASMKGLAGLHTRMRKGK